VEISPDCVRKRTARLATMWDNEGMNTLRHVAACVLLIVAVIPATAVDWPVYPTAGQQVVPRTDLNDPWRMNGGSLVKTLAQWPARRQEIKDITAHYLYGHLPPAPQVASTLTGTQTLSGGSLMLKTYTVTVTTPTGPFSFPVSVYYPGNRPGPFGVLIYLTPNDHSDDAIDIVPRRGYAVALFPRSAFALDSSDRSVGVFPFYPGYDWGSIGAWAWGLHRMTDFVSTLSYINAGQIMVTGHSRNGKAALLAGALDERIALTAPSGSGALGAAPSRLLHRTQSQSAFGQALVSYWWGPRKQSMASFDGLPFDQHLMSALVAPRAMITLDGKQDPGANTWATQQGMFAAKEVYSWLGAGNRIACHVHEGGHTLGIPDLDVLFDWADHVFKQTPLPVASKINAMAYPLEPRGYTSSAPASADDSDPPATPAAPTSSSTTSTTPTLNGTTEAGATLRIYDNRKLIATIPAGSGGAWSWTVSPALGAGRHNLTVTASDAAGNLSAMSPATVVSGAADSSAPAAPALFQNINGDSARAAPPDTTFEGTTEAGATVKLYDNGVLISSTVAAESGFYSYVQRPPFAVGSHSITATATDPSGNTSPVSAAVLITISSLDTAAPATPAAPTTSSATSATATLSGSTEASAALRIYDNGILIAILDASLTSGTWTWTISPALTSGVHALTVTATDRAGNTSGISAATVITVPGAANQAPVIGATVSASPATPVLP
jgi:hypothetical protein